MKRFFIITLSLIGWWPVEAQQLIRYDLTVSDTVVNYNGKNTKAIAINGQLPAPTLYFTEGDTAEIHVHNKMHHETSIHWHGLILPNEQDGVPYLTTQPIKGMSTHIFRFPIVQNGTYWYHSHTMLQEQIGMYGAFIIKKRECSIMPEYTVLLSDWSNENPHQIERSLHQATDWYAIRKGASQSYGEAVQSGEQKTKVVNEFKRMMAMDVSDVYYQKLLMNGQAEQQSFFSPGDKVKLRVINGSASTYFWLNFAGGKITVVANDGADVEHVEVDRMIIGVSETYDVIVTLPEKTGSYEFLATSEDRTNKASLWLGAGEKVAAQPLPRLEYFAGMQMMNGMMTVGGKMNDMGMNMSLQQMDMNTVMYPEIMDNNENIVALNYAMLKSPVKTTLPDAPSREIRLELSGNMNRYVWTLDNKTVSESDKILIRKGENVRIILYNNSMMRHPMHLHGHFFRVLNGQGEYAPLKTVLDILPMETDTLEFHASEDYGDWYFHCHILYHMMSGMGRIFSYENTPPNPQLPDATKALKKVYHDDRRFYLGAEIGLESNGSDGEVTLSNTRWSLQTEWRIGLKRESGYEVEGHFGRYLDKNQFLLPYVGWDIRGRSKEHGEENIFGQENTKDKRGVACVGIQYTLPWFVLTDIRVDHTGNVRFQVSRDDIPLTSRARLWANWNTDMEYSVGIRYITTKYLALSTHYDSDMKWGGGITITY
ncbi:multicopper oxidase domain-containing protein [Catalinimonas niigatensis]|uniref:multicopper oxidase domain-containing protein n=1 Tax=Catalinimonas niigatensis TaxID=1397264 RepID=UPI002666D14A|nr:multicopper oxidase domain-containing protein [Catalinimonas niigatensis]WPP51869.1 multicopper oxidase domain-containing protein [Catalinimonas niigatensis]